MRRIFSILILALGIGLAQASVVSAVPYGYFRHVYAHCPYAANYQPWGVYYRPFPPYFQPYVSPPWGWGYTYPPPIGMGAGVY